MSKDNIINIMEIRLEENSSFSRNFNSVADLYEVYEQAKNKGESAEIIDKLWNNFVSAKYCLEQGIY